MSHRAFTTEEAKGAADALSAFKDWTNSLLVTSVAALGWVGTQTPPGGWRSATTCALCISIIFGIFTLAFIPLVSEKIGRLASQGELRGSQEALPSIYDLKPHFFLLPNHFPVRKIRMKYLCWPQHLSFIIGVILYTAAVFGLPPSAQPAPSETPPAATGTLR
jgi:hypothetical protein